MDLERSMRPIYRHADLLGLSELVLTQCVCVCETNTGGKNEECSRGLSCVGIWTVEAEVGVSAGTCSDRCALIAFAVRVISVIFPATKKKGSGLTKEPSNVVNRSSSNLALLQQD